MFFDWAGVLAPKNKLSPITYPSHLSPQMYPSMRVNVATLGFYGSLLKDYQLQLRLIHEYR